MYLPDEKSIVGRNLQILINQKNWSIKQAAKELNYDRINLSKMLSGSQNFRIKTLVKFAHFFDVPVFLLFNRLFEDEQYRKDFSFVENAVRQLNPYAVDVSSGIETDGLKDKTKMAAFVAAVRKEERL